MYVNSYTLKSIIANNQTEKNSNNRLIEKDFDDWEIPPWELYVYSDRLLGEGTFAKVYLANWRGTLVVAKVIDNQLLQNKKFLVKREFEIMTKLHHPNIVQFLGYVDDPFIIVMEYIYRGDLLTNCHLLTKTEKKNVMIDILRGLSYLHLRRPNSLIHRDIKPQNILLTKSKMAKITDFGLSKFYNQYITSNNLDQNNYLIGNTDNEINNLSNLNDMTLEVGTQRYMSPEVLNKSNYDQKSDIYSCGILLYELFENKRYNPKEKLKWFWTPKKIKKIILEQMLCSNPNDRLDAIDILNRNLLLI